MRSYVELLHEKNFAAADAELPDDRASQLLEVGKGEAETIPEPREPPEPEPGWWRRSIANRFVKRELTP